MLSLCHEFATLFQVAHSNNFDECVWMEERKWNEKKKLSEMEFDFKPRITHSNRNVHKHSHKHTHIIYMWCVMRNTYTLYTMVKAILMREERRTTVWLGIHAYIYLDSMIECAHIVCACTMNRSALVLFSAATQLVCVREEVFFFHRFLFFSHGIICSFYVSAWHCCVASGVQNSYHLNTLHIKWQLIGFNTIFQ